MMQWLTLFQKEALENWRNFKWVWVPLVFILLTIMDPLTMHYMPILLEYGEGLPEGAVFHLPTPSTTEVIMMSIGQLNSIGIVVIVLMAMGTIANERKTGVLELTLVKPVSFLNYITAKWISLVSIIVVSLLLALMAHWYYVHLLFGSVSLLSMLFVFLFLIVWFLFVAAVIILYNTLTSSAGIVAALSIGTIIFLTMVTSTFNKYLQWSPANIPELIQKMLQTSSISFDLYMAAGISFIVTFLILLMSVRCMKKKEIT